MLLLFLWLRMSWFSFHPWRIFSLDIKFWVDFFFFYSICKMVCHFLLASIISEISPLSFKLFFPYKVIWCFSLATVNIFFSLKISNSGEQWWNKKTQTSFPHRHTDLTTIHDHKPFWELQKPVKKSQYPRQVQSQNKCIEMDNKSYFISLFVALPQSQHNSVQWGENTQFVSSSLGSIKILLN